jgi:hypothetical protein
MLRGLLGQHVDWFAIQKILSQVLDQSIIMIQLRKLYIQVGWGGQLVVPCEQRYRYDEGPPWTTGERISGDEFANQKVLSQVSD